MKLERLTEQNPGRITGNPEVVSSAVGLVPTNALAVTVVLLARCRLIGTDPQATIWIPSG